jgi:hypothetical protein
MSNGVRFREKAGYWPDQAIEYPESVDSIAMVSRVHHLMGAEFVQALLEEHEVVRGCFRVRDRKTRTTCLVVLIETFGYDPETNTESSSSTMRWAYLD